MFTGRFHKPGVPVEVLFDKICRENGITHRLTKIHSPTTTGKIERLHQTLQRELLDVHGPFESIEALQKLQAAVSRFDEALPTGKDLSGDEVDAVIDLCGWAHAEWIRIHPFANGNGRTARLWANFLAMRCGLPPFVSLRPRPDDGYEAAGARAMRGRWEPTAAAFRRMLNRFLEEFGR